MSGRSIDAQVDPRRVRSLRAGVPSGGSIVYWMSRDQRADDNWALLFARDLARRHGTGLEAVFCLVPSFGLASRRHFLFMLDGLREVEARLRTLGIGFRVVTGAPDHAIPAFLAGRGAGGLVTDFDPLRVKRRWLAKVVERVAVPVFEVDAHNIVPAWVASDKQEFGAYTLRPKLNRLLPAFLTPFPALEPLAEPSAPASGGTDWDALAASVRAPDAGPAIRWLAPGARAAARRLDAFVRERLAAYDRSSNDPTVDGTSNLSPYLHFGQMAAQRVALTVRGAAVPALSRDAFLEQLIVRRELSDNYCLYCPHYDTVEGFPAWARRTLAAHAADPRAYRYAFEPFASAATHDPLWNAAQTQMVETGKMHNYMRMYWGKKILEWTRGVEEAVDVALRLNDRYELDGRDPNGYAGVAWCMGGVHDRAWTERPVFGKLRYMNEAGCRRKFDVAAYIRLTAGR